MVAFAPILGNKPTTLILGSMPSELSLIRNQYYANPRNCFWWLMSEIFEFDLACDYHVRSAALTDFGIAVWDVLHDCERPGSLDSAIVKDSEVVNDFTAFFHRHADLSRVIFNGAAAETIFKRHFKCLIQDVHKAKPDFEWYRCPSTSPAHASMTKQDKLDVWRRCFA